MALMALGVNHKTAPISLREKLVFPEHQLNETINQIKSETKLKELAVLSTCNRTEIYCAQKNSAILCEWLLAHCQVSHSDINKALYEYHDQDAVSHIMRVTSGLDSLVLGEAQILGQMKTAFYIARHAGTVGKVLHRLFQVSFSVAKQIRTKTTIGASSMSVAYIAVKLSTRVFADIRQSKVLFIGAGDTIDLCAFHLKQQQVTEMIFANRTLDHIDEMAKRYQGVAIDLEQMTQVIAEADLIITATSSPLPIIGKGLIERTLKARKRRPIFMVDLAVPRDIEPEVRQLQDVYLYTIDDLHTIVLENTEIRQQAAQVAEVMIKEKAKAFMQWLQVQSNVDHIIHYRSQAEKLRDAALQKALHAIENGQSPELVINRLATSLTKKLMHQPTQLLRDISSLEQQSQLLAISKLLLGSKK